MYNHYVPWGPHGKCLENECVKLHRALDSSVHWRAVLYTHFAVICLKQHCPHTAILKHITHRGRVVLLSDLTRGNHCIACHASTILKRLIHVITWWWNSLLCVRNVIRTANLFMFQTYREIQYLTPKQCGAELGRFQCSNFSRVENVLLHNPLLVLSYLNPAAQCICKCDLCISPICLACIQLWPNQQDHSPAIPQPYSSPII